MKPDIVYCNTWAYGLEGPLARFGGLDPLYQASSGLEHESAAVHEGNTPLYYRFGMCDASNAMLSVVAVLGALYHRKRTGEGQEVWTSLFDGGAIFTSDAHLVGGVPAPRPHLDKELMGVSATYRLYRTQDDDWICIAAVTDDEFRKLCTVLGVPEILDDARFATGASRAEHRRQLETIFEPRFRTKTAMLLDPHARRRRRPERGAGRHPGRRGAAVRLRQRRARHGRAVHASGAWATCASSASSSTSPRRRAASPVPRRSSARTRARCCTSSVTATPRSTRSIADGVCYEPDDHYAERFAN